MAKPTDKEIIDALNDSLGIVAAAAKRLTNEHRRITRSGLLKRIQRSPLLSAARDDAEAIACDHAESALLKAIRDGNIKAITFFLEHRSPKYRPIVDIVPAQQVRSSTEIEAELASLGFKKTE